MNTIGIGTKIPTATAHTIATIPGINPIHAHRLTIKWAKQTVKGMAHTKAFADLLAEDLINHTSKEDLGNLTKWLATHTN